MKDEPMINVECCYCKGPLTFPLDPTQVYAVRCPKCKSNFRTEVKIEIVDVDFEERR